MKVTIREPKSGVQLAAAELGPELERCEGNWYFDPAVVDQGVLTITERTYTCPYKGTCHWVDYNGPDGQSVKDVGWIYQEPKRGFDSIKGRFGFYAGANGPTREES